MKISLHYKTRNNRRRRHRCSAHLMLAQLRRRRARGRATSAMAAAAALIIQEMEEKEADSLARSFIPSRPLFFRTRSYLARIPPSVHYGPVGRSVTGLLIAKMRPPSPDTPLASRTES